MEQMRRYLLRAKIAILCTKKIQSRLIQVRANKIGIGHYFIFGRTIWSFKIRAEVVAKNK